MAPSRLAAAVVVAAAVAAAEVPGCFFYNWENEDPGLHGTFVYQDDSSSSPVVGEVPDAVSCQALCQQSPTCAYFTAYPAKKECWLQNATARLTVQYGKDITVVGPRECPSVVPLCTALPNASFPGDTPEASMAAWPTGYQPRKSVCWPRVSDEKYYYKADNCLPVHTLQLNQQCEYLFKPVEVEANKTCKDVCIQNPMCASWRSGNATGQCQIGIGRNCKPANETTADGERLARGTVRTLLDIKGVRFNPPLVKPQFVGGRRTNLFEQIFPVDAYPTQELSIKACSEACYSYLGCQYWQFDNTTGCFIDTSGFTEELVQPLTTAAFEPNVPTVVAGAYIQHLCASANPLLPTGPTLVPGSVGPAPTWWPAGPGDTGVPTLLPSGEGTSAGSDSGTWMGLPKWLAGVILALIALCICGLVAVPCLMGASDDENKGGRRRMRPSSAAARRLSANEQLPLMEDYGSGVSKLDVSGVSGVSMGQVVPTFQAVQGGPMQQVSYVVQPPTFAASLPPVVTPSYSGTWTSVGGLQPPALPHVRLA